MLDTDFDFETEVVDRLDSEALNFTAFDRCDACGVQAYTRATNDTNDELLFCLHHRRQHKDALSKKGWILVDDVKAIAGLTRNRQIEED